MFSMTILAAPSWNTGFLPHGYCYLWNRPLLLTHLTSDILIGLSYVVISLSLVVLVYRARQEIPFSILFIAFGLFIVACGMTHLMEVWTLWNPDYWAAGGVKVVTAIASVTTAAAMPFMVPRIHNTIRDAKLAHQRALAEQRANALQESYDLLQHQAVELERQTEELDQQREEAESLAEELEETNSELRLALDRVADARDAAQAANQAKSNFIATMSHELRTPLNAIIGYTSLLSDEITGPVTSNQAQQLGRIGASASHLLELIEEILALARIEAGKESLKYTDVDVTKLLESAVTMVAPQAASKGLTLTVTPPNTPLALETDEGKLRQVLVNLLTNAVKFTDHGSVTIWAACEGEGDQERIAFHVQDTGIGINAVHLRQIFAPFWQVEQSTTRTAGGAGLGLNVSQRFVELLGGEIVAESIVGDGSTFTVRLPRRAPRHVDHRAVIYTA